jgi:hypothetical protein
MARHDPSNGDRHFHNLSVFRISCGEIVERYSKDTVRAGSFVH